MNNDAENSAPVPYKASKNLNTSIGNPSVDINNTMNINIQNVSTSEKKPQEVSNSVEVQNNVVENNKEKNASESSQKNNTISKTSNPYTLNVSPKENSNEKNIKNEEHVYVPKEENNSEEEAKPKGIKLGSEFRMALLIIIFLLAVLFLLPVVSDFIGG